MKAFLERISYLYPQMFKFAVISSLLYLYYYEANITKVTKWTDAKLFSSIPSLCAHISFYKQEMRDMEFDYSTPMGFLRRWSLFRNFLCYCLFKALVDSYFSCIEREVAFDLTNQDLLDSAIRTVGYFLAIWAYEELFCNKYIDIFLDNLKCLWRAESSHKWFYKTISSKDVYRYNLLPNLMRKSLFIGTSSQVTNIIIRTGFRGRLNPGGVINKIFCVVTVPFIQYYMNPINIDGVTSFKGGENTLALKMMKSATVIIFLLLENYSYFVAKGTDKIWSKVLRLPFSFEYSPAAIYDAVKPVENVLVGGIEELLSAGAKHQQNADLKPKKNAKKK